MAFGKANPYTTLLKAIPPPTVDPTTLLIQTLWKELIGLEKKESNQLTPVSL
jgi:hypothetical protein